MNIRVAFKRRSIETEIFSLSLHDNHLSAVPNKLWSVCFNLCSVFFANSFRLVPFKSDIFALLSLIKIEFGLKYISDAFKRTAIAAFYMFIEKETFSQR